MSVGAALAATVPTSWFAVGGVALAIGSAATGLIFRGAAEAWRSERDAAVEKADRLEDRVGELERQVESLKLTNVATLKEQNTQEHRAMLEALRDLTKQLHGNTTATEFLIRQAFPTAVIPVHPDPA